MLLPEQCNNCPDKRGDSCPLPSKRRFAGMLALHGTLAAFDGLRTLGLHNPEDTYVGNPLAVLMDMIIECADQHAGVSTHEEPETATISGNE